MVQGRWRLCHPGGEAGCGDPCAVKEPEPRRGRRVGPRRRDRRPWRAGLIVPGHPITEAEFSRLLESFSHSAWRLETYDTYHLDYEAADFQQFLAGRSAPPTEISWWRPWLDMVTAMTREGKRVGRVRILAEPPTDYQRWELWAALWHAQAGEQIGYLTRSQAN